MFTRTDTCYGFAVTLSATLRTADAKRISGGTSAWTHVPAAFLSYNQEPAT